MQIYIKKVKNTNKKYLWKTIFIYKIYNIMKYLKKFENHTQYEEARQN